VLNTVSYTLSQQEPVFGSANDLRHRPHEKYKRRWIAPQTKTLERYCPNLFVAFNLAKSQSVSDERLFAELPRFIREVSREDIASEQVA
jgi:hypothetical protein